MKNKPKAFPGTLLIVGLLLVVAMLALQVFGYLKERAPSFVNDFKLENPPAFTTLDEPSLGFLMDYPATWILMRLPYGDHGDLTAKVTLTTATGIAVNIHEINATDSSSPLQQIADKHLQAQARATAIRREITFEPISDQEFPVGDTVALLASFKSQNRGNTVFDQLFGAREPDVIEELVFKAQGKSYIISFVAPESAYPELQTIFKTMRESINLRAD